MASDASLMPLSDLGPPEVWVLQWDGVCILITVSSLSLAPRLLSADA